MSFWDKLTLMLYGCVSLSFGVLVCVIEFGVLPIEQVWHYMSLIPFSGTIYLGLFFGSVAIFIGISLFNLALGWRKQCKSIDFRTEKGHVTIVLSAIEEYIHKTTSHLEQIRDIKSKVSAKGRGLKVVSKLVLNSDSNVTNLADTLQKEIEDKLINMIGVDIPLTVNIHITKMVTDLKKTSHIIEPVDPAKPELSEDLEETFRGIEY